MRSALHHHHRLHSTRQGGPGGLCLA